MGDYAPDQEGRDMATKVEQKMAVTERRWREEVERTEAEIEQADASFAAASADYLQDDDDELRAEGYRRCMQALGRKDSLKRRLDQLKDPRELERRLKNSRRLAERF